MQFSWYSVGIRVGLEVFIKKYRIALLSSFPHWYTITLLIFQKNMNTHPVQSARKTVAASSELGTPPFFRYPRFLANKVKNSREFLKSGTLYWSMIWNNESRWNYFNLQDNTQTHLTSSHTTRHISPQTCVLSHCLSRVLTASSTVSWPSSTCRLLRAIEAGGLDGEATTPGLSISFTFFKMCTSCMDLRGS